MRIRKYISNTIVFFVGILIGVTISILIGAVLTYIEPARPLSCNPRTFGDIKIWAQRYQHRQNPSESGQAYINAHKMLWMSRDGTPFLMISQDENGNITGLYLLRAKHEPVLWLNPVKNTGGWDRATYGEADSSGKPVGKTQIDIDFNGEFDFQIVTDTNGVLLSRSIRLDDTWKNIDKCDLEALTVIAGRNYYKFDPNNGNWKVEN